MKSIQEEVAYVGRMMFELRLTDLAGGNVSAREGNNLYISPKFSGSKMHWQLKPDDIITGCIDNDEILEHPKFSREGRAHLGIYRNFPEVNSVIHAHAFHILPFSAARIPIQPILEATDKFGVIDVVEEAPAHSVELANSIVAGLRGKEAIIRKQAAALLLPRHGIIVAGKDLYAALDALQRLDTAAYSMIAMRAIQG
jgi:L-fuculose-phosphate aldolase